MEIGSEFWEFDGKLEKNNFSFWKFGKDTKYVFSGRTAIYMALEDALSKGYIKKNNPIAYLPNYLCDSMIRPFLDLKFDIEFYNVEVSKDGMHYDIDTNKKCDVFFAMNYFGIVSTNMDSYIKEFKKRCITVIEDATHSIFSKKRYSYFSDYVVASVRKWLPVYSGAIAVNLNEKFIEKKLKTKSIADKREAMRLKREYIKKGRGYKETFLSKFQKYNDSLEDDYIDYIIDDESLRIMMESDIQKMIEKRRQNANIIYEKLRNKDVTMFDNVSKDDCPIFVPILLNHDKRDYVRSELIKRSIYLPVHWPITYDEDLNEIYKDELSLVCDQRYNAEDIEKYINELIELI